MHELLALQIGPLANHAAAHFWNAQCVDARSANSVLFRESPTLGLLPRTVIVDFRDAMGAVGAAPESDPAETIATWPTSQLDASAYQSATPSHTPSQYHQLLDSADDPNKPRSTLLDPAAIRAWADYLHPFLDPLSLAPLTRPLAFAHPQAGQEALTGEWVNDTFLDTHVRHFLEDADHPEGVHVLGDAVGGWAGLSGVLLSALADSVPKLPLIVHSFGSAGDPHALAHLVGGLVGAGVGGEGGGGLVHNLINVPDTLAANPNTTAGDLYLGMAQVAPLVDLTLAPVRLGEWHAAHVSGLLGGAVPGCPLVRGRLYMPQVCAAAQRRGAVVFPQPWEGHPGWMDFGFATQASEGPQQHGRLRRPDAELWLQSGPASGSSGPQYVQRTARAVQWTKVDDPRVAFPRVLPYPFPAATAEDDPQAAGEEAAGGGGGGGVVVQYEAGAKCVQGTVQWMAAAVKRQDADMYETLVGMVEHATDGDEDAHLY